MPAVDTVLTTPRSPNRAPTLERTYACPAEDQAKKVIAGFDDLSIEALVTISREAWLNEDRPALNLAFEALAIRQYSYSSQPPLQSAAYKAHGQLQARQLEFGYFVEHADLADDDKTQWLKSDPDTALKELMCG